MPARIARTINLINTGFSYTLSSLTGRVRGKWMPSAIGVELTDYCNLRCPECATGSGTTGRDKGYMDPELYRRIIAELRPWLFNVNLYFQGEPMLHPSFFRFIEMSEGVNTTVSTNGHFLSGDNAVRIARSGLGRLIVSLDGMDEKTYRIYRRGGDFNSVIEGIRNVSESIRHAHSSLKLELQFLVHKGNEHQMAEAKEFAGKVNAAIKFKSVQVINEDCFEEWIPETTAYSRYSRTGDSYTIRSSLKNRCLRLWYNPVILWDGKVVPCCFDKRGDHVMGNMNESSFTDIWKGKKFSDFRLAVLNDRRGTEICRNCTTGLKI